MGRRGILMRWVVATAVASLCYCVVIRDVQAEGVQAPAGDDNVVELGDLHRQAAGDGQDLEQLLHWAIENSDLKTLKKLATEAEGGPRGVADEGSAGGAAGLPTSGGDSVGAEDGSGGGGGGAVQEQRELEETRERIHALYKQMHDGPTEAQLMQDALAVLRDPSAQHAQHAQQQQQEGGSDSTGGSGDGSSSSISSGDANREGMEAQTPEQLRLDALEVLGVLVEPIDNANDMAKMGGPQLLFSLLKGEDPAPPTSTTTSAPPAAAASGGASKTKSESKEGGSGTRGVSPAVRAAAAHVLGVAASNNIEFVDGLIRESCPGLVGLLVQLATPEDSTDHKTNPDAIAHQRLLTPKALYLLGTLLRASPAARRQFYDVGGTAALVSLLQQRQLPTSAHGEAGEEEGDGIAAAAAVAAATKKAVALAADLAEADPKVVQARGAPGVVAALANALEVDDLDTVEKALRALRAWLGLDAPAAPSDDGDGDADVADGGSCGAAASGGGGGKTGKGRGGGSSGSCSAAGRDKGVGDAAAAVAANAAALREPHAAAQLSAARMWLSMQRQMADAEGDPDSAAYVGEVQAMLDGVAAAVAPPPPQRPPPSLDEL